VVAERALRAQPPLLSLGVGRDWPAWKVLYSEPESPERSVLSPTFLALFVIQSTGICKVNNIALARKRERDEP